ncbi:MAG: hypothetical protein JSW59_13705 [Phycisphaerales bacterium]|nr:MAG: hypothetical protein JSW59_13705 [Phycisphaerales bacterium]
MPETAEDKLKALVARVGRVRRWLVTLAILKVAALCLVFASAYIGVYAWLDHRLNFGQIGRVTAFVLLLSGLGFLLHRLTRLLLRDVSCSGAANHIENRRGFNQQLVTAMEYYENKEEYPYSVALAEQLVLRVDEDSRDFNFDSTVEKWQGYALGAIILFGLVTSLFYIRENYLYFSAYFARLTQPVASVSPLSSTSLEPITVDIVAEPNSEVTFAAEIKGSTPELGKLVLVRLESDTTEDRDFLEPQEIPVRPTTESGEAPRFEVSKSFAETGLFKYRFETDSMSTDWHELNICPAPEIESMTARVAIPKNPARREWIKPYNEQIKNQTLEVIHRSNVSLNVQTTDKLKEVAITGLDGKTITKQLNGAKEFTYHFNADRKGAIEFDLVNEQGLVNENLPDLAVVVKTDEPPKFKLICPEGDYLTTDVASVPITFEITDDFGLDSARLYIEAPGYQPKKLGIPIEKGARSQKHSHTIELEEYELSVGDSILFHAEATDVDTGSVQKNRTSSSEVYFIEIRPYRQSWRPSPGGGSGKGGMPPPVELLNILEYTRAILKKTWAIAAKPFPTEQDRSALDSIDNDVRYCADQLAIIRDDSEYGFNNRHKAVLNAILNHYERASGYLSEHNANSAILPEKDAYRLLRKFIIELELQRNPPSSGQGQQPKQPDSVKMQEDPEFSQYEKERIEGEIKKVQQELTKLRRQQKNLRRTFENFLKQQARQQNAAQQTATDKSSTENNQGQDSSNQSSRQQDNTTTDQKSQGSSGGQGSDSEKASVQDSSASQDQGSRQHMTAGVEARLRMLQARQRALQEQVIQLKGDLQQLPKANDNEGARSRSEAQEHLDEAITRMDDFQEKLAEARYQTQIDQKESEEVVELMESARREMDLAAEALDGELTLSEEEKLARQAQKMAEQLAEDADALDESVTPEQEQDMLARLEAAKRLLETMPEPQWATINQSKGTKSSPALVFTRGSRLDPAEAARQLARQFWSISIEARKRQQQLSEDEPSDAKFYGQENEFFENAAKFDAESVQK